MKKIVNWLRGAIQAVVTGAEPEQFLNLCARAALPIWDMERLDDFTLRVKVPRRSFPTLCALAGQAQCTVREDKRWGAPFFLLRFRKRYAMVAGSLLCLALLLVCSRFVWVIDVEGNETVPTAEILSQLRLHGVSVGTYGPSIETRVVANEMLMSMHQLTFFSLNLHGTRAEVLVHEADQPPEVVDREQPTNVIASATGIITHIEPWTGDACFQEGETVCKGEVLITGVMDLEEPEYSEIDLGTMLVHAQGKVLARTWHTMTAEIPLTAQVKQYTGEEVTRYSLSLMGRRMKFYQNSSIPYERYDTISKLKSWMPVGEKTLPLIWQAETFRAYTLTQQRLDEGQAEAMLQERLLAVLKESMDEGEVLKTDYTARVEEDTLFVTLLAECTEQIGRTVNIDTQERASGPRHSEKGSVGGIYSQSGESSDTE